MTTVTCAPKAEKTCANSAETKPPPRMSTRSGRSSMRITVSLVWNGTSSRPGTSGICGRDPLAMTTWSAVMVSPVPVSRVRSPVNLAWPSKSRTLGRPEARHSRPEVEIGSIRPKIRSRISGQRARSKVVSTPSRSACVAAYARSAGWTNILVGMQPTLRQVPPNVPFSRMATFQSAKESSTIVLPEPEPMTARSKRRAEPEEGVTPHPAPPPV